MKLTPYCNAKSFFLFVSAILFLLILPMVMADAEQYLMAGNSRDSQYTQEGTGMWAGRAGVPVTRTLTNAMSLYPLIGDVDGDNNNEIIYLDNGNLIIANYTSSVGIIIEQTILHGNCQAGGRQFYPTSSLYDYDSDGTLEIIASNITHMMMYSWNGTQIVINQSVATNINTTGTVYSTLYYNLYPIIKCAPATQWSSGSITCVMPTNNRSGALTSPTAIMYNVTANTIMALNIGTGMANADTTYHNTHLFDGDSDGFLEAYFAYLDTNNGFIHVYGVEDSGSITEIFNYDGTNNAEFTDIIVNKLDGSTPMISFGYTDLTNAFGWSFQAGSPYTNVSTSYCTLLTCPEGNMLSANMWVDDGTYGDYSGDVCYYVRNYNKNDPGVNIDTIHCLSQYAGEGTSENTVSNSNKNFSRRPIVHEVSISGNQGLLTPEFILNGVVKESVPSYSMQSAGCVPVDYEESGSLDFVCLNNTVLRYFDDAYTNQQVSIDTIGPDTGNPVCSGETLTTVLSISDAESDAGNCFIEVFYANMTALSNNSNTSFSGGAASVSLYYTLAPTTITNLIHRYSCKDQYHSSYDTRDYAVSYSNETCGSGSCYCKGYGAPVPIVTNTSTAAADDDVFEEVWDEFGFTSQTSKTIIGLAVVIGVMVAVAGLTLAPFAIVGAGILTLIIVTFMGLVSAYILILTLVGLGLIYLVLGKVAPNGGV